MHPTSSDSQALELTPVVWVAILVVGLLGLNRLVVSREPGRSVRYLDGGGLPVLRMTEGRHTFPRLGVEIEISEGWSYLSVTDGARAYAPTFVHEASHSIVRLQPFLIRTWPIEGTEVEIEQYGENTIEWAEVDHRRVGRLGQPPVEIMISAVTHQPHARLTEEVRDFCRQISLIREP